MTLGKNALPHLLLFIVALIYGANFTIAKVVLDGEYLQPAAFILLRVLSGVVLFSLFHRFFIGGPVARKHLPLLLLCGIFGVAINQLLFFEGLKLTSQINAALIMTTTPILVLIFSHFYPIQGGLGQPQSSMPIGIGSLGGFASQTPSF